MRQASRSSAATPSVTLGETRCRSSHYADVQFTKAPEILAGMGLELEKSDAALAELREKGLV